MNAFFFFSVVPLAVLGAVLIAVGSFGWGVALWVAAVVLSQVSFLADVWAEYRGQDANSRSLYAALAIGMQQSAGRMSVMAGGSTTAPIDAPPSAEERAQDTFTSEGGKPLPGDADPADAATSKPVPPADVLPTDVLPTDVLPRKPSNAPELHHA